MSGAALSGRLPRPRSYFFVPEQLPAASSEWAVHWAANPPNEVYQAYFEFCNTGIASTTLLVHSSYSRARVWTLRTMREADLAGTPGDGRPLLSHTCSCRTGSRLSSPGQRATDRCVEGHGGRVPQCGQHPRHCARGAPAGLGGHEKRRSHSCPRRYRHYFINPESTRAWSAGGRGTLSCWRRPGRPSWRRRPQDACARP